MIYTASVSNRRLNKIMHFRYGPNRGHEAQLDRIGIDGGLPRVVPIAGMTIGWFRTKISVEIKAEPHPPKTLDILVHEHGKKLHNIHLTRVEEFRP